MHKFFFSLFLFISATALAQNDIIAKEYFKKGEFEKAAATYEKLYKKSKNTKHLVQLVKSYQQLEQYTKAEQLLTNKINNHTIPPLFVELGYNYQLQKDTINAKKQYNLAINAVAENPNNAFGVGNAFQSLSLLNEAVKTYEKAMFLRPDFNFDMQLSRIYGEQGKIDKMFNSYLNFAERNTSYIPTIKRAISDFISENPKNTNNIHLKKLLLKKSQQAPNIIWNNFLSWLFIQQKEYNKAFIQEKAIYKRELENLNKIDELASIASKNKMIGIAKTIYNFIITTSQIEIEKLNAHLNLLTLEIENSKKKDYKTIQNKFLDLFNTYGKTENTLNLQITYAHFLAFYLNEKQEAITLLKKALNMNLSKYQFAAVKLELGDILVLQEKFNEALIYYTQIQRNLKNSPLAQQARFKIAKTSYYKGDFKWAESQLKVLKSSTTQLTANDALQLKLLISDNKPEDSLQRALKSYAKADLLAFQNKKEDAISILNSILENHKTEAIIPQALLKQAQLHEMLLNFENAKINYETLIKNYPDSILVDDALFALANIYNEQLAQPNLAKPLYEKIIFNHADSIYFVEARKKYRALRGDTIN